MTNFDFGQGSKIVKPVLHIGLKLEQGHIGLARVGDLSCSVLVQAETELQYV